MITSNKRFTELFAKYISQEELSEIEHKEFFDYIENPIYGPQLEAMISEEYENPKELHSLNSATKDKIFNAIIRPEIKVIKSKFPWKLTIGIAASIVVCLGILFFSTPTEPQEATAAIENMISPGKSGGTLTLPDGRIVQLSEHAEGIIIGEHTLTYEDGTIAEELESSQVSGLLTANTTNGQTYALTLPDGTRVWLNASSSLQFNTDMHKSAKRTVVLRGEGYFEVASDKKRPFIVETQGQVVEVLGTHFNISNYDDDGITATTLLEGSVSITTSDKSLILHPHQQAIQKDSKIHVQHVDIESVVSWKNGEFSFEDERITEVMRKIARWYDVEIVYQRGFVDQKLDGTVSKFENISKVLHVLELTGTVKFRTEGRRIHVMQ